MSSLLKPVLAAPLRAWFRAIEKFREPARRLHAHARLAAQLTQPLPSSVVVLGRTLIYGTRNIAIGEDSLLYPDLHLETQDAATITIGAGSVLSRGVHVVSMAGVTIGPGCMIGEYTSIRDANHTRQPNIPIRNSGHAAKPIVLGSEVWIGRGVTILGGVTIGDRATVGANAVVTHNVAADTVVAGVPAIPLASKETD